MRLIKSEHEEILRQLGEQANATPEMMDLIQKLRDDFDESLSVDLDEVKRDYESKLSSMQAERDSAYAERDKARSAYRERFWNAKEEADKVIEDTAKDEPKPKSINEVLGIKETT